MGNVLWNLRGAQNIVLMGEMRNENKIFVINPKWRDSVGDVYGKLY
jgi:hypothetical protein